MTKICDHKSVGLIVLKDEKILLIERGKPPFGFAAPAGHVDEDKSFEDAAKRELKEEVGLDVVSLKLLKKGKKNNFCRRSGGTWHFWKVYEAKVKGNISRSRDETRQAGWFSREQIKKLIEKTKDYMNGKISEKKWHKNPGLEPIWYEWFEELGVI